MRQGKNRELVKEILCIVLGTGLMAIATNWIFEPMHLVTGGVTGLGIVIKDLSGNIADNSGVPLWVTNVVCNIPLFFAAYRLKGRRFFMKGMISSMIFTLWLGFLPIAELMVMEMLFLQRANIYTILPC